MSILCPLLDYAYLNGIYFTDTLSAVKLHLAFLQYPAIEFYGRSRSDNQNRVPLIALAWLLGTQDVLRAALRAKLIDGPLGAECWRPANTVDPPKVSPVENYQLSTHQHCMQRFDKHQQ